MYCVTKERTYKLAKFQSFNNNVRKIEECVTRSLASYYLIICNEKFPNFYRGSLVKWNERYELSLTPNFLISTQEIYSLENLAFSVVLYISQKDLL